MGVDVASFGDFFADLRPVGVQAQTVPTSTKKDGSADTRLEKPDQTLNQAQAEIQITVAEQPVKEQALSRHRKRKDQPIQCLVYKRPIRFHIQKIHLYCRRKIPARWHDDR